MASPAYAAEEVNIFGERSLDSNVADVSVNTGDVSSGAYTYVYDLTLPVGHKSATPMLSLRYNSNDTGLQSIVGVGWSLGIPAITRQNKTGADNLYTDNHFNSSLSGDLVQTSVVGEYIPKVQTGGQLSYLYENDVWTVTDLSGNTYVFGTDSTSRQDDPADTTRIYAWYLSEMTDANGNKVTYSYTKDAGMIYPGTISYGFDANGQNPLYQIVFSLTPAVSKPASYQTGFAVKRNSVIDEIQVMVGGVSVHSYDLTYTTSSNQIFDLLSSVTEAADGVALPPTTFAYSEPSINWAASPWTQNGLGFDTSVPEHISSDQGNANGTRNFGVQIADINGDGLKDVMKFYNHYDPDDYDHGDPITDLFYSVKRVHLNQGGGNWEVNADWQWDQGSVPFVLYSDGVQGSTHRRDDMGVRLADVNGDGLTDLVVGFTCKYSNCTKDQWMWQYIGVTDHSVYLNTGGGWTRDPSWSVPVDFSIFDSDKDNYISGLAEVIDINGDGLPDLLQSWYTDNDPHIDDNVVTRAYINNGNGWTYDASWQMPVALRREINGSELGVRFGDFNGDGLVDVLRSHVGDNETFNGSDIFLNTGTGWEKAPFNPPDYFVFDRSHDYGMRILDINGDGIDDILRSDDQPGDRNNTDMLWLGTGSGWKGITLSIGAYPSVKGFLERDTGLRFIDFDGDGMLDAWHMGGDETSFVMSTSTVSINRYDKPNMLTTITEPEGGSIDISYDGFQATWQATDATKIGRSPGTMQVTTDVAFDSGDGDAWSDQYEYEGGWQYFQTGDVRDRRFSGFGQVTKTTDLGQEVTYYHQGNGDGLPFESGDAEALIGMPYSTEQYDTDLLKRTLTRYEAVDQGNDSTFVAASSALTESYDGNNHDDTATEYDYDAFGNVVEVRELGAVDSTAGDYTDIGDDSRTIAFTFAQTALGEPTSYTATTELRDHDGSLVSSSQNLYDNLPLGQVAVGNVTTQTDAVDAADTRAAHFTYDSYGNVLSETDYNGNTTRYTYDSYNLYPETVTNALAQTESFVYDYRHGQPLEHTDVNGQNFRFAYDGLGRVAGEYGPDALTGDEVTYATYAYDDTPGAYSTTKTLYRDMGDTTDVITYLDGFARPIQVRSQAEDTGVFAVKDTVYGEAGLVEKESLPYFSSGSARTNATSNSDLYSTYTYDGLARVTTLGTVVGDTETAYRGWQQTVTDPLGNEKDYTHDAFGQLVQVDEHNGSNTYTTNYDWSTRGDLAQVTDALGNVRHITYDWLSRRVSLEDLHDSADSTYGVWSFVYDDNGNVTETTNPNGGSAMYTYDNLNRILAEDNTDTAGIEYTYTYDSCLYGVGLLCLATAGNNQTAYNYDRVGNVAMETVMVADQNFTTLHQYDRAKNKAAVIYPDASEVHYTYNTANQIEKIEQREAGGDYSDVISDFDYGPHGLVTYQRYGNGVETTKEYDDSELYRLRNITTQAYDNLLAMSEVVAFAAPRVNKNGKVVGGPNSADSADADAVTETDTVIETVPPAETVVEEVPVEEIVDTVVEEPVVSEEEPLVFEDTVPEIVDETPVTPEEPVVSESVPDDAEIVVEEEVVIREETEDVPAPTEVDTEPVVEEVVTEAVADTIIDNTSTMMLTTVSAPMVMTASVPVASDVVFEVGSISLTHTPETITLEHSFIDPIVIANVATYNGSDPVEVRIDNITANSFTAWVDEPEYRDISHTTETVNYLVVEPGTQVLPNGVVVEAGWLTTDKLTKNGGFETVSFEATFTETPAVLSQVQTNIDPVFVRTRQRNSSATSFQVALEEEELTSNGTHASEKIGWLAISSGTGDLPQGTNNVPFVSGLTAKNITQSFVTVSLGATLTNVPTLFANLGTYYGSDASGVRLQNVSATAFSAMAEEDKSKDTEVKHAAEQVDYVAFNEVGLYIVEETPVVDPGQTGGDTSTFGYTTAGGSTGGASADDSFLNQFTLSEDVTVSMLSTHNTTANGNVKGLIYADDGGEPGVLIAATEATPLVTGWTDTVFDEPVALTAGTYWLGSVYDASNSYSYDNSGVRRGQWEAGFASPTDPWDTAGDFADARQHSVYATYTVGIVDKAPLFLANIQNLTYTYDAVGNITQVVDASETDTSGRVAYDYDDLYRLTSAVTTDAATEPYTRSYSYNALGNILAKSDQGSYSYVGNTGSSYANPHAATQIGDVTYTYDQSGNVLSTSAGLSNIWDFSNRLLKSDDGEVVAYEYDHTGRRVRKNGETDTIYASGEYELADATTTKHIYAGDTLVATIEGSGTDAETTYTHLDHLDSTDVVTNEDGYTVQMLDQYPFGGTRIDNQLGDSNELNRFTGHDYDEETDLNYMGARYQSGETGRFISQDPAFIKLDRLKQQVKDPQSWNSYSYSRNNPVVLYDPNGEWFKEFLTGNQSYSDFREEIGQAANVMYNESAAWKTAMDHPYASGLAVGVGSGVAAYGASAGLTTLSTQYLGGIGTGCMAFCNSPVVQKAPEYAQRGYKSFNAFKNAVGSADPSGQNLRQWHHVVEQNPTNVARFGQEAIQNGKNLVNIPTGVHQQITATYNRLLPSGGRFRDYVNTLSYEEQTKVGQEVLKQAVKSSTK